MAFETSGSSSSSGCSSPANATDVETEKLDIGVVVTSPTSIELTPNLDPADFELNGNGQLPLVNKIILTYIPSEAAENELRTLCSSVGPITHFNLVIDRATGERRGYAFAEYVKALDALEACNRLNGLLMHNKRIKVSLARKQDPQIRNANLHISGFPKSWNIRDLYNYFRYLGQVIACKILTDPITRSSKGIAFVRYSTHKQADDARSQLNGTVPIGEREPLIITYAHANGPNAIKRLPAPVIVLPSTGQPSSESTRCSSGQSSDVSGSTANGNGTSAAVAQQPTVGGAATASSLSSDEKNHQQPQPNAPTARSRRRFYNSWPLFVGNLGHLHDETFLRMVFEQFGAIESVKIMKHGGANGGGFGFVNMWNAEEAIVALQHLHNYKLAEGQYLNVSIKALNSRPGEPNHIVME